MDSILQKLLRRGDDVAIERGRLVIRPASGLPVPEQWLADNRLRLCREVLLLAGLDAFEYVGYDTGHYGKSRAGGVTLHFVSVVTGEVAYTIFNADLTRARASGGKPAGSALPKGRFRVGKRSAFYKFWIGTGLPVRRLSDFHDYMGKLGGILFIGAVAGERLNASTIRPITLETEEITPLFPDNIPTRTRQHPDNIPTRTPDKETQQSQAQQGLQPIPTACVSNHGNTVIREDGYTAALPSTNTEPVTTEADAWLSEYDKAEGLH